MKNDSGLVPVGKFGAPHGVRGQVRLKSFTQDPLAIAKYAPLQDAQKRLYELASVRHVKDDILVARVKGVEDRTGAEALTNLELFVPRDKLPAPQDDEFYYSDLIGLRAQTSDGAPIGVIKNVLNFGAGDILEITPEPVQTETLLLPFTRVVVPVIDVKAGFVVVVMPDHVSGEDQPD